MDYKLIDRILALGNLIGFARLAYVEADTDSRVTSWNRGAEDLFGYSEDETMGRFLYELMPLSKRQISACNDTRQITSEIEKQGRRVQCEIYYSPIMNTRGENLGTAVLAKDISARLKEKADLKLHEKNVNDIFNFAPIGFYHVNNSGKITMANPEYAWMMGYESAEALTDQVSEFSEQVFYDPDRAEEFMFGIHEAEEVIRFRCRLKRKDNSFVWALCYGKTTRRADGKINGFNGFAIDISETVRAEQELKKVNEKLKMLSVMDGLTRIPNRRRFDECLSTEWSRHFREKQVISLILMDIDFFKFFNDTYGHQAGDDCLIRVAAAIQASVCRGGDLAARYGGEEFAVVLPDTDTEGAMNIAEKIRENVQNLQISHEKSKAADVVTLSLGVATVLPGEANSAESFLALADEALYAAKENGRNQSLSKTDL